MDGQCSAGSAPWCCQPCHQPVVWKNNVELPLEHSPQHPTWQAPSAPCARLPAALHFRGAPRTGQQWSEAPPGSWCIPTFSTGRCGQAGQGASTHLPTVADPPWQRRRRVPAQPGQAAAPALPAPGLWQPRGLFCQGERAPGLLGAGGWWLSRQLPSQGFPGWPGLRRGGRAAEGCVCGAGRREPWVSRSDSPRDGSQCWEPACSQPRDWVMGWVSVCHHQGWALVGVGLEFRPCACAQQCLLAPVPMFAAARGDESPCPRDWCDPPATSADPPVDTECVRAFREGGESAELSTMSPASTSHQPASASWALPRAISTQQGGDGVGPTAGSPRGPARGHPWVPSWVGVWVGRVKPLTV